MSNDNDIFGDLCDLNTTERLRPATRDELIASLEAAELDGGAGAIKVDGRTCYVESYFEKLEEVPAPSVQN